MLKITSFSPITAMFLFTGCESDKALPSIKEQPIQEEPAAKVNSTTIEEGKTIMVSTDIVVSC